MSNKKKVMLALIVVGCLALMIGVTYAFFSYSKTGSNNKIISGDISMSFLEDNDSINLVGIFPETIEEARIRDDNYVTFTIEGTNTSNKTIYYEIDLIHGDDHDGLIRFNDEDLRFDLVEVVDGEDTIISENLDFDEINNSKIWVDSISSGTNNFSKTYKVRMWLGEEVLISDTNPDANYSASTYKNHYASIKVKVLGDFEEKTLPPKAYYVFEYGSNFPNGTDFSTLPSYTNDYQSLGENVFLKIEGSEKSVCLIKDDKLDCFKKNDIAGLQRAFDDGECHDEVTSYQCYHSSSQCWVNNGGIGCLVFSGTGDGCTISSNDDAYCGFLSD